MLTPAPICVSLGSNIDAHLNLSRAIRLLSGKVEILSTSTVYEAAPVDAPDTPMFLNAAVSIDTRLGPIDLKSEVPRPIEARLERIRTPDRNAPRTIDLDLTLYRDLVIDDVKNNLALPDPEILRRAHIALPLADLAPEVLHPVTGRSFGEIAQRFKSDLSIRSYEDLKLDEVLQRFVPSDIQ